MNKSFSFLLTLLVFVFCSTLSADGPPEYSKPVVVDIAKIRQLAPTAQYSGSVISKYDARISAEVEGRLTWVAEVGSLIKQGEVIARLDDIFLQQQRSEELALIQSEQAKLELYQKEVQRYQRLIQQNNVAQNQLDQSISDRTVAQSNIIAARARLAQIEERIIRSSPRAPFAGVITERFAEAGEWSERGNQLVRLVDTSHPEIQLRVPQSIYPLLHSGKILNVSHDEQTIQSRVVTIVPVGTTTSRLFELRLSPEVPLLPGTLVKVSLPTAKPRQVISVHRDALVIRKGGISIYRINDNNQAEQVPVKVGSGDADYIEIVGDLAAGDRVVTRGGERLRPGETVTVINE